MHATLTYFFAVAAVCVTCLIIAYAVLVPHAKPTAPTNGDRP